jgi:hypothetical protein
LGNAGGYNAEAVYLVCFSIRSSYWCYGNRYGYGASGPDNVRQLGKRTRSTALAASDCSYGQGVAASDGFKMLEDEKAVSALKAPHPIMLEPWWVEPHTIDMT